tara:strand:+ start:208 stop:606 length:399 start_codon:yes stop_codon:yes gene_type:complete
MKDKRYKVTQEVVDKMRKFRNGGLSYQKIADMFSVSYSTALYWCNEYQRDKQRKKNAKRRKSGSELKKSIKQSLEKRKENFIRYPKTKLRHDIQSALNERRNKRKSVKGIAIDEAKKLVDSGVLNLKNSKIV